MATRSNNTRHTISVVSDEGVRRVSSTILLRLLGPASGELLDLIRHGLPSPSSICRGVEHVVDRSWFHVPSSSKVEPRVERGVPWELTTLANCRELDVDESGRLRGSSEATISGFRLAS